jgi:nucleoside-diphosphate-sugar epimerase
MSKKKLLITGASGDIGSILLKNLPSGKYDVLLADIRESDLDSEYPFIKLDIADLEAFTAACEGMHTVIHMAADRRTFAPWETLLPANVIGCYNAFEAAHRAGCKRIIYASSVNAMSGHQRDLQLRPDMPIHPGNLYGATKAWGEAVANVYSDHKDLSCLCLRIGWLTDRENRERFQNPDALPLILTHEDCYRLIMSCVEAPEDLMFGVFSGISDNRYKRMDIRNAQELLGYDPQDDAWIIKEQHESEGSSS